jgi:hypothetical protein
MEEWVVGPVRRGSPAVWLAGARSDDERALWVWDKGEPRIAARLLQRRRPGDGEILYLLGAPGPAGVPLVVVDPQSRWAAWREVTPDPALAAVVPTSGWSPMNALAAIHPMVSAWAGPTASTEASPLRPCKGPGHGPVLELDDPAETEITLDGDAKNVTRMGVMVRLRVGSEGACLEALAEPVGWGSRPPFVRLDAVSGRAEIHASPKPEDPSRSATCAVSP